MTTSSRKFFIYTRKSTDTEDRQVRSLADQLAELRELARKEQLEVVDVFIEKQTAKIPGRYQKVSLKRSVHACPRKTHHRNIEDRDIYCF